MPLSHMSLSKLVGLAAIAIAAVAVADAAHAAGLLTPTSQTTPLTISDHTVTVVVEDGYAVTTIEQTFDNPGAADLEAIYSFPIPEQASVSEFTYWIDGTPVTAEVLPRERARRAYEAERSAGRETGLAEQNSHFSFQMSVWPVPATGQARVRLSYIQPARLDTGIGRYIYPLEDGGTDEAAQTFWTAKQEVHGRFRFDLLLRAGYPVDAIRLPQHPDAQISQTADGHWRVRIEHGGRPTDLTTAEGTPGRAADTGTASVYDLDQDIAVLWRVAPDQPGEMTLLPHKADAQGRGTFVLTLTPGDDLPAISRGRDWTFVVDRSGSMAGKLSTVLEGLSQGIRMLGPDDRFRIVVFNNGVETVTPGFVVAEPAAVNATVRALRKVVADGGTDLFEGLAAGLAGLDADRASGVVLITDGVVTVGRTARSDFLNLVARSDVRLFTMVMGNGADRPLLEHLAAASGGGAINVSNSDDIFGHIVTTTSKLSYHALSGIEIEIDGVRVTDLTPEQPGTIYRGQQLVAFGHYWGSGRATVTVRGSYAGQREQYVAAFDLPETAAQNPEVERLWAFAAIEGMLRRIALLGPDSEAEEAVVKLAVEHGLLTPYTSMVVLHENQFAAQGIDRANERRLQQEVTARNTRTQAPPTQVARAPVGRTAQAHVGDARTSSSGSVGPIFALLLAMLGVLRRRARHRGARRGGANTQAAA